jgi:uncharacterized protein with HEPN domain
MQPDDESLLVDMLVAAREAKQIATGFSEAEFKRNRVLQLALERLVQNIGEAAARLSPQARERLPHVPWHDVVGMRNRLVHDYTHVDVLRVWQVVQSDLDELIAAIVAITPPEGPPRDSSV